MADPHIRAAFYLSPTLDALWRWTADGEVLIWPNDATIAFRAEVEMVLRRLAPGGLPPFGAVALLLAACREGWLTSIGRETIAGYSRVFGNLNVDVSKHPLRATQKAFHHLARDINGLLEQLDAVNRLPREQIEGVAAKALLAEVVFEEATNRSSKEDAAPIMQAIDAGISPESLRPQLSHEESLSQFARQVDGLTNGLRRVNSEMLRQRGKTGLDEPVKPAGEDLSAPDAVRKLLAELRADAELSGLAKLAQDLMAAVSVPRSLRNREDLSIGGVSDLSNRGTLDRLLISELAHDDLTLAVRVAMNEALYLRRESPPREPPHRRAILIDAGIRMWGTPRVFATAVALALSATSDPHAGLSAWRAAQEGIEPIDLTTRDGVESHLGVLETAPHPGQSLSAFFDAVRADDAEHTDVMLITHADVLADAAFAAALSAAGHPPMYIAAVDREGGFTLHAYTKSGHSTIRDAKLSLDAILSGDATAKKRGGVPLINKAIDRSLPAIFYADPFPFLLPYVANPRLCAVSKYWGLVTATRDGRLLFWRDHQHGAQQISAQLPKGLIREISINDSIAVARVIILAKRDTIAYLIRAEMVLRGCTCVEMKLPAPGAIGAFLRDGLVYVVYADAVRAFSEDDGNLLASVALEPGMRWNRQRFFTLCRNECYTISYDGSTKLKFERIPHLSRVVAVFDSEGYDAPLGVRYWASIVSNGQEILRVPDMFFREASPDGRLVAFTSYKGQVLVDLRDPQKRMQFTGNPAEQLRTPQIYWSTCSAHTRTAFKGIFVDPVSRLWLWTLKNELLCLELNSRGALSFESHGRATSVSSALRPFQHPRPVPGARLTFSVAAWADGSKAFLDYRGLLHLKSSDPKIPELSFTLSNLDCGAWSSNGLMTGPKFFVWGHPQTDPAVFMEMLRAFIARLR